MQLCLFPDCCWAIAAAGAIESLYNIVYKGQYNNILQAAPQHLIDCLNPNPRDIGPEECYTSTVRKAFKWILSNKGIAKEKDYQFNARRGNCKEFLERKVRFLLKIIYSTICNLIYSSFNCRV